MRGRSQILFVCEIRRYYRDPWKDLWIGREKISRAGYIWSTSHTPHIPPTLSKMEEVEIVPILKATLKGLEYLHSKRKIHRLSLYIGCTLMRFIGVWIYRYIDIYLISPHFISSHLPSFAQLAHPLVHTSSAVHLHPMQLTLVWQGNCQTLWLSGIRYASVRRWAPFTFSLPFRFKFQACLGDHTPLIPFYLTLIGYRQSVLDGPGGYRRDWLRLPSRHMVSRDHAHGNGRGTSALCRHPSHAGLLFVDYQGVVARWENCSHKLDKMASFLNFDKFFILFLSLFSLSCFWKCFLALIPCFFFLFLFLSWLIPNHLFRQSLWSQQSRPPFSRSLINGQPSFVIFSLAVLLSGPRIARVLLHCSRCAGDGNYLWVFFIHNLHDWTYKIME